MRSKKALYNIASNLLLQVIIILYGFIVPKMIITSYGSSINGLVSSITQFLAYITLLESGIGPVVKSSLYKPLAKKDNKTIINIIKSTEKFFRTISIIFIIYIVILSLVYPMFVSKEFEYMFTISLILIISISTFAEYYFGITYRLLIQADQKTYFISIIQIITYILSIITIVVLAKLEVSIHILKLLSGLIFVMRPIIQNLYVKRKYKLDFSTYDKNYKLKNKWDGLAQHIAYVIHNNTDITLLTIFSTLVNVSIYSVYAMVNKGIKSLIQSFTSGIDASWGDMIAKHENNLLNNRFNTYELLYMIIITVVFSSTLVLIIPFVSVYTLNIKDTNYIFPLFGFLIVLSEYIWGIRLPYHSLVYASGHFKETKKGAWIECLSNIIISIILVRKYGLIGVAIGTIVAMTIRTIELIYHTNKYVLRRKMMMSVKKIILVIIETTIILLISKYLPMADNVSYINFIINAIMVVIASCIVVLPLNILFYKSDFISATKMIKGVFKKA